MIKSFKDKETESIAKGRCSPDYPREIQNVARRKLKQLNNAISLEDLKKPPGNHFEKLKGVKEERYSN